MLSGPRPVGGIDALGNRLEQLGDNLRARPEKYGADDPFDIKDRWGVFRGRQEQVDQALEFLVLRAEEVDRRFFLVLDRSARVLATICPAYCSTSDWNFP